MHRVKFVYKIVHQNIPCLAIVLSVLRFTAVNYRFDIVKLFLPNCTTKYYVDLFKKRVIYFVNISEYVCLAY
jgi:hypothetical protein